MTARPSRGIRESHLSSPCRYQSLEASYGEAKRERFLRELAELEENVHLARSHAQSKLDRYAIQQMVWGLGAPWEAWVLRRFVSTMFAQPDGRQPGLPSLTRADPSLLPGDRWRTSWPGKGPRLRNG